VKLKREQLVLHLQRLSCGGQVTEVVFTGAFGATALTPDHLLLVEAPSLPKVRALTKDEEGFGIGSLDRFIKALGVLSGVGNEAVEVEMRLEEHRLIVDEGDRGLHRVMTAQPKTISTYLEPEVVEKLWKKAPKPDKVSGIQLTRQRVEGIRLAFALWKVTEVELFVGPKGGKVLVGNDNSDQSEFPMPEFKAPEEYSLLLGPHFIDVLSAVTDYTAAMLYLAGPEQFVLVTDGDYKYLLSPKSKGAEASAPS
jgi:hypothetical protein